MIQSTSHELLLGKEENLNLHLHDHITSNWCLWLRTSRLLLVDTATRSEREGSLIIHWWCQQCSGRSSMATSLAIGCPWEKWEWSICSWHHCIWWSCRCRCCSISLMHVGSRRSWIWIISKRCLGCDDGEGQCWSTILRKVAGCWSMVWIVECWCWNEKWVGEKGC